MKKKIKGIIALILALMVITGTMNYGGVIVNAEETSNIAIGEVVTGGKLREGPGKVYDVVTEIPENTILYITGASTNEYDNVWFEVPYFGETKYIFSDSVVSHIHEYNIPVADESGNDECYICECGSIECIPEGISNTSVLGAVASLSALEQAMGLLAAEVVAYYGLREICGYIIPVMINTAGALVSVTMEQFEYNVKKLNDENVDNNSNKVYYPSILIKNTHDSVEIRDYANPLDLEEACNYVDNVLVANDAFGRFDKYTKNVEACCNIYTVEKNDAERLCNKIVTCPRNDINMYGNSKRIVEAEQNSAKRLNGTYAHYHLFNVFDEKSVVHILFGNTLYNPSTMMPGSI